MHDIWWLGLAKYVATASKDPSTKVGCVILDKEGKLISIGHNRFVKGTLDFPALYEDKQIKYARMIHAETDAIIRAPNKAHTLYCTHQVCQQCMMLAIEKGIKRVVYIKEFDNKDISKKEWIQSNKSAICLASEARVDITEYRPADVK